MNKKRITPILSLTLIALGLVLLMILPYLIKGLPFEYGGDLKPTYFPYYTEFRSLIAQFVKKGQLPFYSWNLFLGNNCKEIELNQAVAKQDEIKMIGV